MKTLKEFHIQQKKGGIVSDLVMGIAGLVIGVIIVLVIVSTLLDASLLGSGNNQFQQSATNLSANFTAGINNISNKIPTILLIGAVVLLFGVIVLLVAQSQRMGIGGGGGSL